MAKQKAELVMWETVRRDCKYPESDNNEGYIFGINLLNCSILELVIFFYISVASVVIGILA